VVTTPTLATLTPPCQLNNVVGTTHLDGSIKRKHGPACCSAQGSPSAAGLAAVETIDA